MASSIAFFFSALVTFGLRLFDLQVHVRVRQLLLYLKVQLNIDVFDFRVRRVAAVVDVIVHPIVNRVIVEQKEHCAGVRINKSQLLFPSRLLLNTLCVRGQINAKVPKLVCFCRFGWQARTRVGPRHGANFRYTKTSI